MANANPSVTGNASLPDTASSKGGLNASTPAEQRVPTLAVEKSGGPVVGENGSYGPASYDVSFTSEATTERPAVTHVMTRTDR